MRVCPTTRNVYRQYELACIVDSMREVDLDADAGVECRKCGGHGHKADKRFQSLIVVLSLLIAQATRRYYKHNISEGHMTAGNELCPFHGRASCFNCGALGHTHDKCKDPIISAAPARGKGKRGCFHCHGDHDRIDFPHPWCGACKSIEHSADTCPNVICGDDTVETGMQENVAQEPVNWDTIGVKDTSFGW
jgi:hypothetical protein